MCINLHNLERFEVFQHDSCRFAELSEDMNLNVNLDSFWTNTRNHQEFSMIRN